MDYDAQLVQYCPPEYVEMAHATDLTQYSTKPYVIDEAWMREGKGRAECINALIAWFTPKIDARSNPQYVRDWLAYLSGYFGPLPDALRADVRKALLRLGARWSFSMDREMSNVLSQGYRDSSILPSPPFYFSDYTEPLSRRLTDEFTIPFSRHLRTVENPWRT